MNVVQQHTRSHVLVDRNGMVSTAAGAGPGAIAGFIQAIPNDPYLANPLRLIEVVVKEQNKTGCVYSPSPVYPPFPHVPRATPWERITRGTPQLSLR
jgi:hypothetical protein